MTRIWSKAEVDRVVPKNYPNGREIPPATRREIYAYYLLEKKLKKLKSLERVSSGKKMMKRKSLRKVV